MMMMDIESNDKRSRTVKKDENDATLKAASTSLWHSYYKKYENTKSENDRNDSREDESFAFDENEVVKRLRELGLAPPPEKEGKRSKLLVTQSPLLGRCELTPGSTSTNCHVRWKSDVYTSIAEKRDWMEMKRIPIFGYWGLCNMIQKFSNDVAFGPMVVEATFLSHHFPHVIPVSPMVVMVTRNETVPAFITFTESLSHLRAICYAFESRVDATKSREYVKMVAKMRFNSVLKAYRDYRAKLETLLNDAKHMSIFIPPISSSSSSSSSPSSSMNNIVDDKEKKEEKSDPMKMCKLKLCLRYTIISMLFQRDLIHAEERSIAMLTLLKSDVPTPKEILELDDVVLTPFDPMINVLMTYERETLGDPTTTTTTMTMTTTMIPSQEGSKPSMTSMYVEAISSFFLKTNDDVRESVDRSLLYDIVAKQTLTEEVRRHFKETVELDYVRRVMLRCAMWGKSSTALFTMNFSRWKKNVADPAVERSNNNNNKGGEDLSKIAMICALNRSNEWRDELLENADMRDDSKRKKEGETTTTTDDFERPKKKKQVDSNDSSNTKDTTESHRCRCVHEHVSFENLFCNEERVLNNVPTFDSEGNTIDEKGDATVPFGKIIWDAIAKTRVPCRSSDYDEDGKDVVYDTTIRYVEHMLCCVEGEFLVFGRVDDKEEDKERHNLFDLFSDACDITWEGITFDARPEEHHIPGVQQMILNQS